MKTNKEFDPLFQMLRDTPPEFSIKEIDRMVVGFPLLPSTFDWSTFINLKTIIMTSISALFLAGAISLLSGSDASSEIQMNTYQEEASAEQPGIDNNLIGQDPNAVVPEPKSEPLKLAESEPEVEPTPPLSALVPLNPNLPESDPQPEPLSSPAIPSLPLNKEKVYDLKGFNAVSLSTSVDVIIKQGSEFYVKASGDPDFIEELELKVKGDKLSIGEHGDNWKWSSNYKPTTIHITMPHLNALNLSGSGDMTFEGFRSTSELHLTLAGSGNISGQSPIDVENTIKVSVAGSGDISVSGSAAKAYISVAGSGNVHGEKLQAKDAKVSIAGSGDVYIACENELDASIAGSGDVNYTGNAHTHKSIVGSGDVNHR